MPSSRLETFALGWRHVDEGLPPPLGARAISQVKLCPSAATYMNDAFNFGVERYVLFCFVLIRFVLICFFVLRCAPAT